MCELAPNQEADFFALLAAKEELKTRDNKPYYKVTFSDRRRAVTTPIWSDSAWAAECRDAWQAGEFYKLRAAYRESSYGPQLEIKKIRLVAESDAADGFDPLMCLEQSRFAADKMFDELVALAEERIANRALRALVVGILREHRATLLALPAATRNHHAYVGGFLEQFFREPNKSATAYFQRRRAEAAAPRQRAGDDRISSGRGSVLWENRQAAERSRVPHDRGPAVDLRKRVAYCTDRE
ncbi:MAG: hypothetical protein WD894_05025 [Pirellulales bacterium]